MIQDYSLLTHLTSVYLTIYSYYTQNSAGGYRDGQKVVMVELFKRSVDICRGRESQVREVRTLEGVWRSARWSGMP
jgi:hypothetical protein